MKVEFVAGFAPIVPDADAAQRFYRGVLGLPLVANVDNPEYAATDDLAGVKHFGVWTIADAAESCFGTRDWPDSVPRPQATIEFELATVEAVTDAAAELTAQGHTMVHGARTEPWGQTVARLIGPEGLLIGLSFAPWFHDGAEM